MRDEVKTNAIISSLIAAALIPAFQPLSTNVHTRLSVQIAFEDISSLNPNWTVCT